MAAYTALQLLEVLVAIVLVLYGIYNNLEALALLGAGYLVGKAVLNILAPEGGSVYRRSVIGYAVGGLVVLSGLLLLHFR